MEESLDHDNYFGTRTISIAICGGSISRMTGLVLQAKYLKENFGVK